MTFALLLIMSFWYATPNTDGWQCRNPIEITCDSEDCVAEKEGAFTPMSVSFDGSGKMSVCAYTGCWEGTGEVVKSGDFLILTGQKFKFSTAPDNENLRVSISITLDKSDNIGTLKAGTFAHPLVCNETSDMKAGRRTEY